MRDALNFLLTAADIEHANFHSLRHTFATRAIENGVPVKTLSDILGHSQVQITIPVPNSNTKPIAVHTDTDYKYERCITFTRLYRLFLFEKIFNAL